MLNASHLRFLPLGPRGSFRVLALNSSLEGGQARLPETSILIQPGINSLQGGRIEVIEAVPALPMLAH